MLPYGKQSIDDDDIAAVVAALKSDFLTCGPEIDAFEREFAEFVGAKHAIAVCNATAALHLAMLVADIGPGDRVVTSPNTFLASANCAAYVGAIPDFADIDPLTYNLCARSLEANWKPDTKAVIPVAFGGQPADMPEIARIARANGAVVIEDACHGTGGGFVHDGRIYKLGGHPWADMTTFSFHPVKTMTTGEGGMLVTDNDDYARRARLLRSHGMVRDPASFTTFVGDESADMGKGRTDMGKGRTDTEDGILDMGKKDASISSERSECISHIQRSEYPASRSKYPSGSAAASSISHIQAVPLLTPGPWTYEMQALGYNFRITDIQCALGRSQLKKLPGFIKRRQEIVDQYNAAFTDIAWLKTPKDGGSGRWDIEDGGEGNPVPPISSKQSERISNIPSTSGSAAETPCVSWHLYTVQIDFEALGKTRSQVMAELREKGVGTQVLYIPVYLQPWYQKTYGHAVGKCPNAEAYYTKALSLPLYPMMTDDDVEQVVRAIGML